MSHFPVADSLKVHSRVTLIREIVIALQCPISCEILLINQFTIYLYIFLGREIFVGVNANLYGIECSTRPGAFKTAPEPLLSSASRMIGTPLLARPTLLISQLQLQLPFQTQPTSNIYSSHTKPRARQARQNASINARAAKPSEPVHGRDWRSREDGAEGDSA
jgi:hypothetical protein